MSHQSGSDLSAACKAVRSTWTIETAQRRRRAAKLKLLELKNAIAAAIRTQPDLERVQASA